MDFSNILTQLKAGNINAKEQAMKIINTLSPAQKNRLKGALPQVEQIARQLGIPTDELNQIGAHL